MVANLRANKWIKALENYLEPDGPNKQNEWYLKCPLHDDKKRSASLNVETWQWYCQACSRGGHVRDLVKEMQNQGEPAEAKSRRKKEEVEPLDPEDADLYHKWLMQDEVASNTLMARRGLNMKTLRKFQIGWHRGEQVYVIPVFDTEGSLVNLRYYDPNPKDERRKIYSEAGHGEPVLYPISSLEYDEVVLCEGEFDALATIQAGLPAITKTGGATTWNPAWNEHFRGKTVYVCHDMDKAGQQANQVVVSNLRGIAEKLRVVELPYDVTPKHGRDLTDFWLEGHSRGDFLELAMAAEDILELHEMVAGQEPTPVTILESFSPDNFAKKLAMRVTVTGRSQRPYLVPKTALLTCDMGAGPKCDQCPMNVHYQGEALVEIKPYDPVILGLVGAPESRRLELVKEFVKPNKCDRLAMEEQEPYSVTEMFVRPAIDFREDDDQKYLNRKVYSVGAHDTMPNTTVMMTGAIYSNPRTAHNEFQAWEVSHTQTDLDTFEITKGMVERLKVFQGDPTDVLERVSDDLAANVTGIYGRSEMHQMMDLVFHSVLSFPFQDDVVERGWLEALILGDTRTGKSEVATKLIRHYGVGEVISCEGASFAGVVGGLESVGGSKEWVVRWGAIPQNDRRLVALDEVTGLSHDQIGQMSSIRSSGIAQLTKIQSEQARARTRLIWVSNCRGGGMVGEYTYGVQALLPLIGSNEDVARFDMAMTTALDDVAAEEINSVKHRKVKHVYTEDLCRELIQWVWTRTVDDIVWERGAAEAVLQQAIRMSQMFWEEPPLVQGANVRIKLARIAVAMAARCFSTDAQGKKLLVTKEHVRTAADWLINIYEAPTFGYAASSQTYFDRKRLALESREDLEQCMVRNPGLMEFMSGVSTFTRNDVEGVLGMASVEANSVINTLYKLGVVSAEGMGKFKIESSLKTLLREWAAGKNNNSRRKGK